MKARTLVSRRRFLLAAGAGSAAGAAALLGRSPVADARKAPQGRALSRGYHATGHINNYYRTTKV